MDRGYQKHFPSENAIEHPLKGPEFDVRINPFMTPLPNGYTYFILKKGSFVIGDYNTWLSANLRGECITHQVFETEEAAQRAAYDYVQGTLREFSEAIPFAFPTGKEIVFQMPELHTSIL